MYLNQCSVRVVGGNEIPGGYVEMVHGAHYSLCLHNHRAARADARVEIDGKHVGTWRLEAHSAITLERPEHDPGRFTFYRLGTAEAEQAALAEGDPNLGLVKVTFTPEREPRPLGVVGTISTTATWTPPSAAAGTVDALPVHYCSVGVAGAAVSPGSNVARGIEPVTTIASHAPGGTGLSGHSGQVFGTAPPIEYDPTQQTVIHLRLVATGAGARPLTCYSTPVPPAVR